MKKIIVLTLFVFSMFSMYTHAQALKFSKVKINLEANPNALIHLASLGVGIDHGQLREGVSFTSDFSASEVAIMKNNNIGYEVLVDDVAADFHKRNKLAQKRGLNLNTTGCNSRMGKVQNPVNFSLGSMGGYYTFNQMKADLDKMAQLYPNLISVKASLATTIDGNPIYYVRISDNPSVNESEPEVLYTALHHSREPASLSQLMYFMWYLLENYSKDPTVKHIVDNTELYLVPCVNPDGYKYNESTNPNGGGMWRKNRKKIGSYYGVDLNRNYGLAWGYDDQGSSSSSNSEAYRGPKAFSEIETSTIKSFCESHNFLLALNYHTFGNLLIYPWGYKSAAFTPDSTLFDNYAQKLTADNQYLYGVGEKTVGYLVNGDSDDWMYGEQATKNKIISMTPESGAFNDGFWPTQDKIIPICRDNLLQNIEAALFAGTYATVEEVSSNIFSTKSIYSKYQIKRFGMAKDGQFTVSIAPVLNVASVGGAKTYAGLAILETKLDSIALTLSSSLKAGETFSYSVSISNGSFSIVDTITKVYGTPVVAFSDNMASLDKWTASGFQLFSGSYASSPYSVTDSPTGKYATNVNASLTLKSAVSLAGVAHATLKFKAKWDIESGMDHFKVQISTNKGVSWQSLCGKYAKKGTEVQGNDIIFDGVKSSWVQEDIHLDSYIGSSVLIRFSLASDGVLNRDGLYIDDVNIETVSYVIEKSSAKEITAFSFVNPAVKAQITGSNIFVTLPYGTDLTKLLADFQLSDKATVTVNGIEQVSGTTVNNFSNSLVYIVTAEDGTTQSYTVFVSLAKNSAKVITSYLFTNPVANGVINGNTITLQVPAGTDVKKMVASFTASPGATLKVGAELQQSGITSNDFTNPITYTVVADDGTSEDYQVIVLVLPIEKSSEKELLSFGITKPYTIGVIAGTSVSLTVPYGTDLSSLIAFLTVSPKATAYIGSVEQVTGVNINNFSLPVSYTITAEDGTTNTYVVSVKVDKNPLSLDAINLEQVAVYPNPTTRQFYVQARAGSLSISVADLQGKIVYSLENPSYIGNALTIDLSALESSVYMVHVTQNGVSSIHKVELIK